MIDFLDTLSSFSSLINFISPVIRNPGRQYGSPLLPANLPQASAFGPHIVPELRRVPTTRNILHIKYSLLADAIMPAVRYNLCRPGQRGPDV